MQYHRIPCEETRTFCQKVFAGYGFSERESARITDVLLEADLCDPAKLKEWYPEFAPYEGKCRFSPCMHRREPDCAVQEAVKNGEIHEERWKRYDLLFEEQRIKWRDRYD